MMKDFFKITIKIILIISITIGLWSFLTPYFRIDKDASGDQFRNLPTNTLDILVLGSSHAQYSMNPAVIYEETGYYSYVLGSGCQPMSMSYYMLEEALKTQKPEVVVLDVFTMMSAHEMCYADGVFYRAIEQMSGETRMDAADNIDNHEKINEYKYDLLMNHGKWKRQEFKFEDTTNYDLNYMMGYVSQDPKEYVFRYPVEHTRVDYEVKLAEKGVDFLKKINQLCKENNIKLLLMKAPIDIDQKSYDELCKIWDVAEGVGIDYIDLIEHAADIGFAFGVDGDSWHNSNWGAEKCSKYIANYIKDNKLVKHHQKNKILEELCTSLSDFTVEKLFKNNIDIYKMLEFANKYNLTIIVKYDGKYRSTITEEENILLNNAGINHDFVKEKNKDYYAVIRNQKTLIESDKPIMANVDDNKIFISEEEIKINDIVYNNLGELQLIFCGNELNWYNEVAIDCSSRWLWENGYNGWECEDNEKNIIYSDSD